MLRPMPHANALERIGHPLLALARIHAAIGQWQLDILVNREIADQIETLKDEANFAIPNARTL
jgi:hypothetical protein